MAERIKTDICVIGAGSGGLSVAAAAAAFGVPVVLVEKAKMGGECLNTGCVPSKSLIAAARHAHAIAQAPSFGVTGASATVDFSRVHAHVQSVIAAVAPNDSKERFTGLGVRVIEGAARFKNRRTVAVGDIEVRARRFVIATGSSPALPPIPGLDATAHLTNETVFDLTTCPEHLIVIGAGAVGLELAQAFRRLGAEVTVLEAAEPLAREDPECAAIVLDQLVHEGIKLHCGISVAHVEPAPSGVHVVLGGPAGEEVIAGSHLLIATGRRPNIEDLALKAGRVRIGPKGIRVNKRLRTTNRRVYAIGDVTGRAQFTHAANDHAGLVIRNALFRLPVRVTDETIPRVTFTDPELAQVGLSEAQARLGGRNVRVLRWPYHENDRAQTERATRGHIKVVTDRKGRILGATIVGASAGELITAWTLAISRRLNIRAFAGIVVPYPTLAEIGKRAAITYFTPSLTSPWVRRIISFLRHFG
jgi:pyruvate/2-oxoglutarate dehydrogenase complex dihydrolipoamide dehydrogenase (E3) component